VFSDPSAFTVTALASGIRRGQFDACSVAAEVIERCARFRSLNALISQDPERLFQAARRTDDLRARGIRLEPLHGVPVLIKDNIDTVDYPTTAGTPGLVGDVPCRNAPVVERLLAAGALVAGKTNLHELAVGGTSTNLHFGQVRNPWRKDVIAGGSSGGSAAAVATRLAPAALGTDTNGSVRGPCSMSGIAGFRPSFQRYPAGGVIPPTRTRDSVGIMANCVADLALLDGALAAETYSLENLSLRGLRLGHPRGDLYRLMDERTRRIIDAALRLLERSGAEIVEANIPELTTLTAKAAWVVSGYEVVRDMPEYMSSRGTLRSIGDILEHIASPVVRERFTPQVADVDALKRRYDEAMAVHRPRLQQVLATYFTDHALDAIVFPTTPFPAPPLADDTADLMINGTLVKGGYGQMIQNTVHQSAAGIPSLTVPAGLTPDGLPVGISFDGPRGSDRRLLAIGHAFETARGPFPLPPILKL
jgi:mandelamide amidase